MIPLEESDPWHPDAPDAGLKSPLGGHSGYIQALPTLCRQCRQNQAYAQPPNQRAENGATHSPDEPREYSAPSLWPPLLADIGAEARQNHGGGSTCV